LSGKPQIKELSKTYFYGCSRVPKKDTQNHRYYWSKNQVDQRLVLGNLRKKSFNEFKSLLNAPGSTKEHTRKNKASTKKYSTVSSLKSQKKSVNQLKEKLSKLIKHKETAIISKSRKLEVVQKSLDEMYEKYAVLANETLEIRILEDSLFEDYVAKCQEKEKAIVDAGLETSNQQTKIKLLHETLAKRSQEHNKLANKNKELVCALIMLKTLKLKEEERKIAEVYKIHQSHEKAFQYEFPLDNSK
jgi:vacuolar-type H+-ATPase subunit I/STV1